jgi:sugar phosphate isomerase/epimerase
MTITRRNLIKTLGGAVALAARPQLWAAGQLAWPGPIGLEIYTVRHEFAQDPAGTLKQVAATGYKEVETSLSMKAVEFLPLLKANGLAFPSGHTGVPKTLDEWKESVETAKGYGVRYLVVGDNPRMDAEAWKKRADFFNQCGAVCLAAGMQFCYHAHFNELASLGATCGYDIMLTHCDARHLQMEMDIFWTTYAGADPLRYFRTYPGRFPLLHIKDLYKDVTVNPHESPPDNGPNPFAPVGQGKIDWPKIFAHVGQAGTKHIFTEQDRCNMPPFEAMKISFNYLKNLRLG